MGNTLMDHRHGLIVDVGVTKASGYAQREAALVMLDRHASHRRRTPARDKGYDIAEFTGQCRARGVTPHVAVNDSRTGSSTLDLCTLRHASYRASRRLRKRIDECCGWSKDGRPLRKIKLYGTHKVES